MHKTANSYIVSHLTTNDLNMIERLEALKVVFTHLASAIRSAWILSVTTVVRIYVSHSRPNAGFRGSKLGILLKF